MTGPPDRWSPSLVGACVALAVLPAPDMAQEAARSEDAGSAAAQEAPEFLSAVPESPAFIFLGTTPAKVTRPGSIRDFGVALLNGFNSEGRLQQGFALEVSPWSVLPGRSISLSTYQSNWIARLLTNAQLSLGTLQVAGDSTSTDLAFGVRFTLIDRGDPMRDPAFTVPMSQVLDRCLPATESLPPPPEVGNPETLQQFGDSLDALRTGAQKCLDTGMRAVYKNFSDSTEARWNAARLGFAFATGFRFAESDLSEGTSSGIRTWLVGAHPVTRFGQIIAQFSYTHRNKLGEEPELDLFNYGARFVVGPPRVNGFLELVGESRNDSVEDANDTSALWSVGVEFRLAKDLWLSTGFGSRLGTFDEAESAFVIADLRWGVSSKARFGGLRSRAEANVEERIQGGD